MKSSINVSKENNKENEGAKPNPPIESLKNDFFLQKLYDITPKKKKLEIVKYNKKVQNRLNLGIKDYKEYSETYSSIEIEIILAKGKDDIFLNIDENDDLYYHIYFNDNKEEIKNKDRKEHYRKEYGETKHEYYITEEDKITKIKIILDYQVKSFQRLFSDCKCIESINFKKFYRNNITDMGNMFAGCSSLKELNLNNFNTNNVTDMSCMFFGCSSLKELNLNNFNTNNVTNMRAMFSGCSSLKELNLNNFNTNNVTNMSYMFRGCSDDLKMKIKSENKNIKYKAFW